MDAFICGHVRSPFGRWGGALAGLRPDSMAAHVLKRLVERARIDPAVLDDVIMGTANGAGEENRNVARMASLIAGFPVEVPGQTINRLCASSLQAIISAAQSVWSGQGDVFIAGGVESMTRAPLVMLKSDAPFARGVPEMADTTLGWRFSHPKLGRRHTVLLGETAENVTKRCNISREAQDELAALSQAKAARAMGDGTLAEEIVPITVPQGKGEVTVSLDGHPRPETTAASLAKLRPAFAADGSVTAGSSSGINDGASAILIASAAKARELGLKPIARVVATESRG